MKPKVIAALLILLFSGSARVYADYAAPPKSLSEVLDASTTVVLASVTEIPAKPADATAPDARIPVKLSTITVLKGSNPGVFELWSVPAWSDYMKANPGMFFPGAKVIVPIHMASDNRWEPSDEILALLPVTDGVVKQDTKNVLSNVVGMLLPGISNVQYRHHILTELSNTVEPDIAPALNAQIKDMDLTDKDLAFSILGANHDWRIIPQIAELEHQAQQTTGFGVSSLSVIRNCNSASAVQYINPLVNDEDGYVRINAIISLDTIADKTSIPYLMKCLSLSDDQNFIHYKAYTILCRLVPRIGDPKSYQDFSAHQSTEIDRLRSAIH